MESVAEIKDFIKNGHKHYRPGLSIDCAIFGYDKDGLKILLIRHKLVLKWCLPGDYIRKTETLDEAASRIADNRTGAGNLLLKQFKAFGDPDRHHKESVDLKKLKEIIGSDVPKNNWLSVPTVTIGYYAITDIFAAQPKPNSMSTECVWFPINKLPSLGFDHDQVVKEAIKAMRFDLYHLPVGMSLLPNKFTLREIKEFYEVMSGKTLNASNFPNKLIAMGLIKKTTEKINIGAHRSPTYYTFNKRVYEKALKEGLVLV